MKLLIPPILVLFFFGLLMYLLDVYLPFGEFDFFGRRWSVWGLGIAALLVMGVAIYQFGRAGTTTDPSLREQSNRLVTHGIYRYSRNPMYLAMLMLLLAWGLWLGNAFNTLLAALFVAYMNRFQISREEEALGQLFGKGYQKYCLEVRRWF
jgi:protein-S-isoprenylcysteine O-methyltransferase Ste14